MSASVTIGEFSRLTHLTVKTLRHYHDQGLLVPHAVDQVSGYRRYAIGQVPDALLIGRLRALDMPLAGVRRVLDSPDTAARDAVIADHLLRMETELDRTRAIVTSLRGLLTPAAGPAMARRTFPDQTVVAVTARVAREDIEAWCGESFEALAAGLRTGPAGPAGALYSTEFFTDGVGEVTAYIPVTGQGGHSRREYPAPVTTLSGGAYAVAGHSGPYGDIDRTYGALGSHVAAYETAAPGPIREVYLVGPPEATDPAAYRTEVCWPLTEPIRHQ